MTATEARIAFETPLADRPTDPGRRIPRVLEEPLRLRVGGETIAVPAGFTTDFASVPRFLWFLFPRDVGRRASVVHDYLYRGGPRSRREADRIFYAALRAEGVAAWRAALMWLGVRLFGWRHYGERPSYAE